MGGMFSYGEADIGTICRELSGEFEMAMDEAIDGYMYSSQRILGKYKWTKPYRLPISKYKNKCDQRMKRVLQFYDANVPVSVQDWTTSCIIVNYVLEILETMFRMQTQHPYLEVDEFIPSGSSCEGLKVGHADEFDVLVPIRICDERGSSALEFRKTHGNMYLSTVIHSFWYTFKIVNN